MPKTYDTPDTVEHWRRALGHAAQPDGVSHYEVAATHILARLHGYKRASVSRRRDVLDLANALEALVQIELEAVR